MQDVTYHQTIVERVVRAGSLTVESAGRHGQDPFPDISRPDEVQSLINRVVSQGASGYPAGQAPATVAASEQEPPARRTRRPRGGHDHRPHATVPPIHEAWNRRHLPKRRPVSHNSSESWRTCTSKAIITDAEYEQKRLELLDRL